MGRAVPLLVSSELGVNPKRISKEARLERLEPTLRKIFEYVSKHSRYLRKYFLSNRSACGYRHNSDILCLYESKDYQRIESQVYSIRVRNFDGANNHSNGGNAAIQHSDGGVNGKQVRKGYLRGSSSKGIAPPEKVVIKRRILNDYMNIINKRSGIVAEIEENLQNTLKMQASLLQYFQNYYSKRNSRQFERLQHLLLPKFKYILRFVSNKGQQFKSRIKKNTQSNRSKRAMQQMQASAAGSADTTASNKRSTVLESQNKNTVSFHFDGTQTKQGAISSQKVSQFNASEANYSKSHSTSPDSKKMNQAKFSNSNNTKNSNNSNSKNTNYGNDDDDDDEAQKLSALEKKAIQQKQQFKTLAKAKGYFFLENSDSNSGGNISGGGQKSADSYEAQKYGSDKMKLKLFESEMRKIIRKENSSKGSDAPSTNGKSSPQRTSPTARGSPTTTTTTTTTTNNQKQSPGSKVAATVHSSSPTSSQLHSGTQNNKQNNISQRMKCILDGGSSSAGASIGSDLEPGKNNESRIAQVRMSIKALHEIGESGKRLQQMLLPQQSLTGSQKRLQATHNLIPSTGNISGGKVKKGSKAVALSSNGSFGAAGISQSFGMKQKSTSKVVKFSSPKNESGGGFWSNESKTMQYSSHTRIKSSGNITFANVSSVAMLMSPSISSSSNAPLAPVPNIASFKRFREKYFQKGAKKETDNIQPTFTQISLAELRRKSLSNLPLLTFQELKNSLSASLAAAATTTTTTESAHSTLQTHHAHSLSHGQPQSELENGNPQHTTAAAAATSILTTIPQTSQPHAYLKKHVDLTQKRLSLINELNPILEGKRDSNYSGGAGIQANHSNTSSMSHANFNNNNNKSNGNNNNNNSSSNCSTNSLNNQIHENSSSREMLFRKKLNQMYLEEYYDDRILNRKSLKEVQPPMSTLEIRTAIQKHNSTKNIFASQQQQQQHQQNFWQSEAAGRSFKQKKNSSKTKLQQQSQSIRTSQRQAMSQPYISTAFSQTSMPTSSVSQLNSCQKLNTNYFSSKPKEQQTNSEQQRYNDSISNVPFSRNSKIQKANSFEKTMMLMGDGGESIGRKQEQYPNHGSMHEGMPETNKGLVPTVVRFGGGIRGGTVSIQAIESHTEVSSQPPSVMGNNVELFQCESETTQTMQQQQYMQQSQYSANQFLEKTPTTHMYSVASVDEALVPVVKEGGCSQIEFEKQKQKQQLIEDHMSRNSNNAFNDQKRRISTEGEASLNASTNFSMQMTGYSFESSNGYPHLDDCVNESNPQNQRVVTASKNDGERGCLVTSQGRRGSMGCEKKVGLLTIPMNTVVHKRQSSASAAGASTSENNSSLSHPHSHEIFNNRAIMTETAEEVEKAVELNGKIHMLQSSVKGLKRQLGHSMKSQKKKFAEVAKQFDTCINRKERPFIEHIKEIDEDDTRITQMNMFRESNKKKLSKRNPFKSKSDMMMMSSMFDGQGGGGESAAAAMIPKKVAEFLLRQKKSKTVISVEQNLILTKKLTEYEAGVFHLN